VTALAPVAPRERVAALDVLRGFALLGVLIGNAYSLYSARSWEGPPDRTRLDAATHFAVMLLVESKAQTLLTFLFGFGFAAQLLRAEARHEPVMGLYLRRLAVLGAIGALHVMLWFGDVTWTYAVAGFALLLFLRASDRTLLVWAFVLCLVPFAVASTRPVVTAALHLAGGREALDRARVAFLAALHGKRFLAVVAAHLRFALVFQAPLFLWYYPWLVGRFLFGYVAGRQRWFDDDGAHHLPLFRKLLVYGLIAALGSVALLIAFVAGVFHAHRPGLALQLIINVVRELGLLGQTAAYMAMVVLLLRRARWRRLLLLLAPAGRMPLTTYISQSVICTAIYYGWGFGLAGKLHSAACVGLSLAIFTLQVCLCHVWLRYFRFGPLEWVWRALVYRYRPPMRSYTDRTRGDA
jgi:uncharacterized protein